MKESAPLQFRNDVTDEIRVGPRHISGCDDKAVAAPAGKHLFQFVRDLLGTADDRVRGLAAAAESDKITSAGVGLTGRLEHAVADAQNALHAVELLFGQGLIDAL